MRFPRTASLPLVAICFGLATWAARAQDVTPVHTIDGEFIREWLVLGPFFPDDLETDFLTDVGGEANVNPNEGDTVIRADGETLTWTRYTSERNFVDLADAVGYHENTTAYAFCALQSEDAVDTAIGLRNDDGITVRVNGQRVYSSPTWRALSSLDVFDTNLTAGANRCLVKVSQGVGDWGFAIRSLPNVAVISGRLTDEEGQPISNADVGLEQDGEKMAQTTTDDSGSYRLNVYPVRGVYDLSATSGEKGVWRQGIRLGEGERRAMTLTLKEAVSISGTLLMLDDKTPHAACVVQAVKPAADSNEPTVVATTLSDENGEYRFTNLSSGEHQVRCYTGEGEYVYHQNGKFLRVEQGKTLSFIDVRFAPFKKGTWKTYTHVNGLAHNWVWTIYQDAEGLIWFGTEDGASQFDGKGFVNFTRKGGVLASVVTGMCRSPNGDLWFGSWWDGGISRYSGKEYTHFPTITEGRRDGVFTIYREPDGVMWFGTLHSGVIRYDGRDFVNFTKEDGLAVTFVKSIHRDPEGLMWFAGWGGVSRYNGDEFVSFTKEDGPPTMD